MDEDSFIQAFEDVKRVSIFSGKSLADELTKVRDTLAKTSNDWKVRMKPPQKVLIGNASSGFLSSFRFA